MTGIQCLTRQLGHANPLSGRLQSATTLPLAPIHGLVLPALERVPAPLPRHVVALVARGVTVPAPLLRHVVPLVARGVAVTPVQPRAVSCLS